MADVPLTALRRFGLAHTELAAIDHSRGTCGTIRPRLLKIGVCSIRIAMPPACSNAASVPSRAPDHPAESAPSAATTASNKTEPASGETSADRATALLAPSSDRRLASGKNHCHAQSWREMRAKADPLMPSANPAAAHGAAAPDQKEVSINDAVDALDNAINRAVSVVMADAALGLSASQGNRQGLIMLMGSLVVPRLVIPPANGRRLLPRNATSGGHAVTDDNAVGGVKMPSALTGRPGRRRHRPPLRRPRWKRLWL